VHERDEFAYQEMIVHLGMCSHSNPKNVLVIGGGDGGCLREVCKHDISKVTLCEIDSKVCDVSKIYFPKMSEVFQDKRVDFYFADGCQYLRDHKAEFDVIIVDSSDPVGPAETLFGEDFFQICADALKKGGILITQAECMWLHLDLIGKMVKFVRKIFANVEYAFTVIPTYPSGTIGFFVCRKEEGSCVKPLRLMSDEQLRSCQYYNSEIHSASFTLPSFVKRIIQ